MADQAPTRHRDAVDLPELRTSIFELRASAFWYAFLAVWAFSQLVYGAVAPWALAIVAAVLATLNLLAWRLLPGSAGLPRAGAIFLAAVAAVFALQLLPIAPLYPYTTALRRAHGIGVLWPGTADAFLTTRALTLVAAYALSALLVVRLRQAGLSSERMLKGACAVLAVQGVYALFQVFGGTADIPFYGPRVSADASGTLVNRNSFAGLMGMGLMLAIGLAIARFTWPARRRRRLEGGLPWAVAAALFATCLILAGSRGGTIAALTGLATIPFLLRGRFSAAGVIILVLLGAAVAVAANPTMLIERFERIDPYDLRENDRWAIWSTTAAGAAHQPVLGFGVGTHPQAYHPFQPPALPMQMNHAHNEYVNAFFEGGAVWLALLVGGLAFWFRRARRGSWSLHGPDRAVAASVLSGVIVIAVHSLVDFDLQITAIGILFAILIGIGTPRCEPSGTASALPVVAIVGIAAAAATLALTPGDPQHRALALSPYDYRAAWFHARATDDDRRFEIAADLWPAGAELQSAAGLHMWRRWTESNDPKNLERSARCLRRLFEQQPSQVPEVMAAIWDPECPLSEYEELLPPDDPLPAAEMAGYLVGRDRWKEGLDLFERRCQDRPRGAPAYDRFAAALDQAGQWGLAALIIDRRLNLKSDADAYEAAARAWSREGVHDKAADRAATAVRIDPANAVRRALSGDVLRAKGDWAGALAAYTEAIRLAPFDPSHRLRRADLYLEQRMWREAADDLRDAMRSYPNDGSLTVKLARALASAGDKEGAIATLQAYVSKHPGDGAAKAALAEMEK